MASNGEAGLREFLTERFDRIEARLDRVEARLDRVEARLDRVEARMSSFEARMGRFETQLARFAERQDGLIREVTIIRLAYDVEAREEAAWRRGQEARITDLQARLERLEA